MTVFWPQQNKEMPVFYEADADYHHAYETAMAKVGAEKMMRKDGKPLCRVRFYTIPQAVRQVAHLDGDFVEAGCYRGMSSWLTANEIRKLGKPARFHLCDSFEGLSEPTEGDAGHWERVHAGISSCAEDEVRKNLAEFDFIEYHKGWIPQAFENIASRTFRYVHIDVNLYDPTLASLEFLWPRMVKGGVALFDDYGATRFPGARRAIDDYMVGRSDCVMIERPSGQAVAVKL